MERLGVPMIVEMEVSPSVERFDCEHRRAAHNGTVLLSREKNGSTLGCQVAYEIPEGVFSASNGHGRRGESPPGGGAMALEAYLM